MDDEDLFEDVPRDVNSLIIPNDVYKKASKDQQKLFESPPIFVPAKTVQVPSYRSAQSPIVETSAEKYVGKEVVNVFSSAVSTPFTASQMPSFGNDYFQKNLNYVTNTSIMDNKISDIDSNNKNNAMNVGRSNVSSIRRSLSGIVNQKFDSTHQPEYGGYESMKDKLNDSTIDNRFNKVYGRQTEAEEEQPPQSQRNGLCSKRMKNIYLWLLVFLLLSLILGFLVYSLFGCKAKKKCSKTCEDETTTSAPPLAKRASAGDDKGFSLITAESMESSEKLPRLNPAIFPTAYYITIVTDFVRFEYNLRVHILIYINEITNVIIIHGSNFNLNAYMNLIGPENEIYDIATVNLEIDTELLVLTLNRSTVIGEYNLTMHYSGIIETEIGGYYRISYKSPNSHGDTWLAVTDFKPDKAHLLFPCFDHPMFKATFSLVFGLLDNKSFTVSNMGKVEQRWKREIAFRNITELDVSSWEHYDTTPLMPTMSLAFIAVPNKEDFDVKHRNFVNYFYRKHLSKQMEFVMDWTDDIVKYFETYFNSLYSLPNLHIFSVPNLNPYGVGSWGIILLSESQILNDPKGENPYKSKYPIEQGKQVLLNLSHKLALQWFGTGFTMSDLSEDWIFEGFAVYMKYRALNSLSTDWTDPGHFYIEIMQPLLLMESLISTVKYHENHKYVPDAAKGAILMRMMENMITRETFDMAMKKLTNNKKLQVVGFMDICELLSAEAQTNQTLSLDLNLCDFLKPYVKQRGYPVLKLSRNYVTNEAMITQQQFILGNQITEKFSESNDPLKNDEQMWVVPSSIINKGFGSIDTQLKTWMPQKEEFSIGILTTNEWALLNHQASGLYRVNYDKRNWDMIKQQLYTNYQEITTVNRAQIVDDILNLARANMVDYYLAFEIIEYLSSEKEYIPWAAALNNFEFFDSMLRKTPQYGLFKKFVLILISDVYQSHCTKRTESNEGTYVTQLLTLIDQWACHLDHPACTEYSIRKFYQFMARPQHNSISAEERYMVYCTAIKRTTYKEWNFLLNQYLKSDNQHEKELILKCLACTHEPWIIELYLWHIVSSTTDEIIIQPIHYPIIIEHLAKNPVAYNVVIDNFLKHWKSFRKLSRSNTVLTQLVKSVFFFMNTEVEYDMFKNWSRKNSDEIKEGYELLQHVEAAIENNIFFMKTYLWQVVTWMQSYVQNNTHKLPVSCIEEVNRPGFGNINDPNNTFDVSPTISRNHILNAFRPHTILPESPFVSGFHSAQPINHDEFGLTTSSKLDITTILPVNEIINNGTIDSLNLNKSEEDSDTVKTEAPNAEMLVTLDHKSDLENFVNDLTQSIPVEKVIDDQDKEITVTEDEFKENAKMETLVTSSVDV